MVDAGQKLEVEVSFGGFSCGDHTARLGVKISRSKMTVQEADAYLCGARLKALIFTARKGDSKSQQHFDEMLDKVEAICDCKQFIQKPEMFSVTLTFAKSEELSAFLCRITKKDGKILIERIANASSSMDDDDDDDEHPDVAAGRDRQLGLPALEAASKIIHDKQSKELDPGKRYRVGILEKAELEKLAESQQAEYAGQGLTASKIELLMESTHVETVWDLEQLTSKKPNWFKDVNGFGKSAVDVISEALLFFRKMVGYAPEPGDEGDEAEEASAPYEDLEHAYKLGAEAALEKKTENDNPFDPTSASHAKWHEGFKSTDSYSDAETESDEEDGTMLSSENTEEVEQAS